MSRTITTSLSILSLGTLPLAADLTVTNGDFEGPEFHTTTQTGGTPRDHIYHGLYAANGDGWFNSNNPGNWSVIPGGPTGSGTYGAKENTGNHRGIVNIITDDRATTGPVTVTGRALHNADKLVVKAWGVRESTPGRWDGWIDLTGPSGNDDALDVRNFENSLAPDDPGQTSSTAPVAYTGSDFTELLDTDGALLGLTPSDEWQDFIFNLDLGDLGYDQIVIGFAYHDSSGTRSGIDDLAVAPGDPLPEPALTASPETFGEDDEEIELDWSIANYPTGAPVELSANRSGIDAFDVTATTGPDGASTQPLTVPYTPGVGDVTFTLEVTDPNTGIVYSDEVTVDAPGDDLPNVLVVLVDDMGWSDIGPYGGEIHTPALDRLASEGLRFRDFHNEARCAPTRNALLTGLHMQTVGTDPNRSLPPLRIDNNVTIAEMLGSVGYSTYLSGKWHLSEYQNPALYTPLSSPTHRGFEYAFGASVNDLGLADLHGTGVYWDEDRFDLYPPDEEIERIDYDGSDPRASRTPFFKTDANTDYAIEYINHHRSKANGEPFFMYLSYNAPHFHLKAPKERINRYTDVADPDPGDDDIYRYEDGWDVTRQRRYERQIAEGVLPEGTRLPPFSPQPNGPGVPPWDSLSQTERDDLSRRMAAYAAMVHGVDENLQRLFDHLDSINELDDTIILFMSDNGGNAERGLYGGAFPRTGEGLEELGQAGRANLHLGGAWANVNNTPFRYFKHHTHEGGSRTPMIVRWPNGLPGSIAGQWTNERGHVIDILPTILDSIGLEYPETFGDHAVEPVEGISLMPALKGGELPERDLFIEHETNRAMYRGDWKLVTKSFSYEAIEELPAHAPELYNLRKDPTEMNNLAFHRPEFLAEMTEGFNDWAASHEGLGTNRELAPTPVETSPFVMPRGAELLVDNFNRGNADDLDAEQLGISGTLLGMGSRPVGDVHFEGHNPGNATISNDRLRLAGSVESGIEANLDAPQTVGAGGFAIEFDLTSLDSPDQTADDYVGVGVGLTGGEARAGGAVDSAASFRGQSPADQGVADCFVEIGADSNLRVRIHGEVVATIPLEAPEGHLLATFELADGFSDGGAVEATVYFDEAPVHSESFVWREAGKSFAGLSANTGGRGEIDNLIISPLPATDSAVSRYGRDFGLDGLEAAPEEDPDGDGLSTTGEWMLGTDPGVADAPLSRALAVERGNSGVELAHNRVMARRAAGVEYRIRYSPDLSAPPGDWPELVPATTSASELSGGYERLRLALPGELADSSRLFFTLELVE